MLYAEGIQKQYLRKRKDSNVFEAVKESTLEIANGKIMVIHGRSGSGKSTLLNMLSGILKPTKGRVLLGETDLYQLDDVRRALLRNEKFGVVPQGQSAIYSLNVLENVLLVLGILPIRELVKGRKCLLMHSPSQKNAGTH